METALSNANGRSVYDVLGASRAHLERSGELGDGLRLAQWHKRDEATTYSAPGHHTISVYLSGGFGTHVAQQPAVSGSPGRVCLLPAEHESHWIVEGELRFLHLYVSALAWAERVVRLIDAEPRAVTLEERFLVEDVELARWAQMLAGYEWASADARLRANASSHAVLDRLVLNAARPVQRSAALRPRGGLSGQARRRVVDWVEANLHERFTLADLCAQVALSEFHFARMFRVSMGVTPHAWVSQRRFARARNTVAQAGPPARSRMRGDGVRLRQCESSQPALPRRAGNHPGAVPWRAIAGPASLNECQRLRGRRVRFSDERL